MAARRELSDFERGMIVGARRMGHAISEIVQEFGFPRSTVSRVYRQYCIDGISTHVNQRTGRPRAIDERNSRRLSRMVTTDRRATVHEITANFNAGQTQNVSERTVRRHLHSIGFGSRRPTRVPLLTRRHRAQRLEWARRHRNWTVGQWHRVAWSDESRFQLFHADGRVRVWRRPHEAMDPSCLQGTVQAGGGSVMVWGVFTWSTLGPLVRLEQSLTGMRYVDILADHLHPFMTLEHPDGEGVFQQDNATCHQSLVARRWIEEHSTDFTTMIWPPRSPDMNPLEHLWDTMETSLRSMNPAPSNATQLWSALQDVWAAIPAERYRQLVDSMPRRVAALLRARGGPTRY